MREQNFSFVFVEFFLEQFHIKTLVLNLDEVTDIELEIKMIWCLINFRLEKGLPVLL